jgi:hypothetical protein
MKRLIVLLVLLSSVAEANAFWWLLRGATVRGAATTAARGAAVAGTGSAAESTAAFAYSRPLAAGARYCVRPVGAAACDLQNARTASDAAQAAVGSQYRIRATNQVDLFQVIDTVGNIVSLIEAVDRAGNSGVEELPQYVPPNAGSPVFIHNRTQLQLGLSIRGESCSESSQILAYPGTRTDVNCLGASRYFVEISTTDYSGQRFDITQNLPAGRHFELILGDGNPRVWQLSEFNGN